MRLLAFLLAGSLVLFLGCGQGEQKEATGDEHETTLHEEDQGTVDAQVASTSLKGTLGCGHCNYQVGESCAAAVKTAEGDIVILEGVANGHELFDRRQEQMEVALEGKPSEDGKGFSLTSYEIQ